MIPEDDLDDWLISNGVSLFDFDELESLLPEIDPGGRIAIVCSDRVFDQQFEEWGVDGMPARYLSVRDEDHFRTMLLRLALNR